MRNSKDTLIKVKYGNEEILAKNNAQFMAKANTHKIIAYLEERKAERVIHVKNNNLWVVVLNFGVFSGVLYSYYLLLKKYLVWM